MYIDKLDNLVNKHSNMCHKTTNMKPADVKSSTCSTLMLKIMTEILTLKLVIKWEHQNIKTFS